MKNKLILIIVFILAIGAILLFNFWQQQMSSQPATASDIPKHKATTMPGPKFVMGAVTKIDNKTVTFDAVPVGIKTATVNDETKLLKQVKDKKGLLNLVPAVFSDIKVGGHVIVYYKAEPSGSDYIATEIHVSD